MNFLIISVGRVKSSHEGALFKKYTERIKYSIIELNNILGLTGENLKTRENSLLISKIPQDGFVVALDRRGEQLSSMQLAAQIEEWQIKGIRNLVFLIGGASGFNESTWDRANFVWSLGLSTWPHLLVRVLLIEQIYRSQCILSGHPYHRE